MERGAEGDVEGEVETDTGQWTEAEWEQFRYRLAEQVIKYPVLLSNCDNYCSAKIETNVNAAREAALLLLSRVVEPPLSVQQLRREINTLKRLFLKARSGGAARARWYSLVEPCLVARPELAERAERALLQLTERARRLRTLAAARVCGAGAGPALRRVWRRALRLVRRKRAALHECGDGAPLPVGARLQPHEWRLLDAMLLFDEDAALVREGDLRHRDALRALADLFHLVQQYRLEEGGAGAGARWAAAAAAWRRRGRPASAVLLQRRWHELKAVARRGLAAAARCPTAARPHRLLTALARRYPHVLTRALPPWRALVRLRRVHEDCELEPAEDTEGPVEDTEEPPAALDAVEDEDEDDLILVEREIETVDLLDTPARRGRRELSEERRELLRLQSRRAAERLELELRRQLDAIGGSEARGVKREPESDSGSDGDAPSKRICFESDPDDEDVKPEPKPEPEPEPACVDHERKHVPNIDPKLLMEAVVRLERISIPPRVTSQVADIIIADVKSEGGARDYDSDLDETNLQIDETIAAVTNTEIIFEVDNDTEDKRESSPSRQTKKVQLPNIEEVRRINRGMLTAQVAPITAAGPLPVEGPLAVAGPLTAGASEEADIEPQDDSSDKEADNDDDSVPEEDDGCTLTPEKLLDLLNNIAKSRSESKEPRNKSVSYCCTARRHRAINDARMRIAARAGRHAPPLLDIHGARCKERCSCCCVGALHAVSARRGAASVLARDTVQLYRTVLDALQHEGDEQHDRHSSSDSDAPLAELVARRHQAAPASAAASASAAAAACDTAAANKKPTPKPSASDADWRPLRNKRKKKRRNKRDKPVEKDDTIPESDPLKEWIRQKNITSRFFDLHLKKDERQKKGSNTFNLTPRPPPVQPPPPPSTPPAPPPVVLSVTPPAAPPPIPPASSPNTLTLQIAPLMCHDDPASFLRLLQHTAGVQPVSQPAGVAPQQVKPEPAVVDLCESDSDSDTLHIAESEPAPAPGPAVLCPVTSVLRPPGRVRPVTLLRPTLTLLPPPPPLPPPRPRPGLRVLAPPRPGETRPVRMRAVVVRPSAATPMVYRPAAAICPGTLVTYSAPNYVHPAPVLIHPAAAIVPPALVAIRPAPAAVRPTPVAIRPAPMIIRTTPPSICSTSGTVRPAPATVRPAPATVRPAPATVRPATTIQSLLKSTPHVLNKQIERNVYIHEKNELKEESAGRAVKVFQISPEGHLTQLDVVVSAPGPRNSTPTHTTPTHATPTYANLTPLTHTPKKEGDMKPSPASLLKVSQSAISPPELKHSPPPSLPKSPCPSPPTSSKSSPSVSPKGSPSSSPVPSPPASPVPSTSNNLSPVQSPVPSPPALLYSAPKRRGPRGPYKLRKRTRRQRKDPTPSTLELLSEQAREVSRKQSIKVYTKKKSIKVEPVVPAAMRGWMSVRGYRRAGAGAAGPRRGVVALLVKTGVRAALQEGAPGGNTAANVNVVYRFSALTVSVSEWMRESDTALSVYCLDSSRPFFLAGGRYFTVFSGRELRMSNPSYWSTSTSLASCRQIVLDNTDTASMEPDKVRYGGYIYKKMSDDPLIYAKCSWVIRSSKELASVLKSHNSNVHVVSVQSGRASLLRVRTAWPFTVACSIPSAARTVNTHLNTLSRDIMFMEARSPDFLPLPVEAPNSLPTSLGAITSLMPDSVSSSSSDSTPTSLPAPILTTSLSTSSSSSQSSLQSTICSSVPASSSSLPPPTSLPSTSAVPSLSAARSVQLLTPQYNIKDKLNKHIVVVKSKRDVIAPTTDVGGANANTSESTVKSSPPEGETSPLGVKSEWNKAVTVEKVESLAQT